MMAVVGLAFTAFNIEGMMRAIQRAVEAPQIEIIKKCAARRKTFRGSLAFGTPCSKYT
jgi:hypothetical protein